MVCTKRWKPILVSFLKPESCLQSLAQERLRETPRLCHRTADSFKASACERSVWSGGELACCVAVGIPRWFFERRHRHFRRVIQGVPGSGDIGLIERWGSGGLHHIGMPLFWKQTAWLTNAVKEKGEDER